ncbi:hypothetical protein LC574_15940 [Nostoc sp. CHAB 5715]|nr:hypothetical protein [Nostoc sp. CHAB 5715]
MVEFKALAVTHRHVIKMHLKAKLQATACSPKVPSHSRFDLREVETQLKLAR